MINIKLKFSVLSFLTFCLVDSNFATSAISNNESIDLSQARPFFILLGGGYSYSNKTSLSVNLNQWDPAVQGYSNDLGNTVLYTAGIGYNFTPFISADIEITKRPFYSYSKYQVPAPGASTPGFAGIKTRKFDLANNSIMANFYVNGKAFNLFAHLGNKMILQPLVGVGLGVAYNTVSDFHSVQAASSVSGTNNVTSTMGEYTKTTFAWQAILGAEVNYVNAWAIDLGYRYFNGGTFQTNNYLTNVPSGTTTQITVSPWSGKLTANEWFIHLKYFIA